MKVPNKIWLKKWIPPFWMNLAKKNLRMLITGRYFSRRIRRVLAFLGEDKGSGENAPWETSMEISSKRIVDRVRKFGGRPIRATTRRHRFSLSLPVEPSPSHFRNHRVRILRYCQHRSFPAVSNPKERGDIAESVNYDPTARLHSFPLLHWYLFPPDPLISEGWIPAIIAIPGLTSTSGLES